MSDLMPGPQIGEQAVISYAGSLVGIKYQWGGKTARTGFDCSGLVHNFMNHFGVIDFPWGPANNQMNWPGGHDTGLDPGQWRVGDLLFFCDRDKFDKTPHAHHVGIYLGNRIMLSAPGRGKKIGTPRINLKGVCAARRVLNVVPSPTTGRVPGRSSHPVGVFFGTLFIIAALVASGIGIAAAIKASHHKGYSLCPSGQNANFDNSGHYTCVAQGQTTAPAVQTPVATQPQNNPANAVPPGWNGHYVVDRKWNCTWHVNQDVCSALLAFFPQDQYVTNNTVAGTCSPLPISESGYASESGPTCHKLNYGNSTISATYQFTAGSSAAGVHGTFDIKGDYIGGTGEVKGTYVGERQP